MSSNLIQVCLLCLYCTFLVIGVLRQFLPLAYRVTTCYHHWSWFLFGPDISFQYLSFLIPFFNNPVGQEPGIGLTIVAQCNDTKKKKYKEIHNGEGAGVEV